MKKYMLGAVAVILALSVSAFAHQKELSGKMTNLYWFKVDPGEGDRGDFLNTHLTLISTTPTATPPPDISCDTGDNSCIVGYAEDQMKDDESFEIEDSEGAVVSTSVGRTRDAE